MDEASLSAIDLVITNLR